VGAALAMRAGDGVASFTVRFAEREYDEGPLARQLADRYHLDYHELTLSSSGLMDRLHKASWLQDEPLAHGNDPHIWAISEYAKPRVTVLLSGEGADEVMGGYVRYQPLRHPWLLQMSRAVVPRASSLLGLNGRLQKLGRMLALGSLDRFVMFNTCDAFPADLAALGMEPRGQHPFREKMLAEAKQIYPSEPMRQAMYLDQHTFLCSLLDRNDRMTMGASIECRVPFLDYRLVERLAALPSSVLLAGRHGKHLIRDALGSRLPADILNGRKWGFGVPWAKYLREMPDFHDLTMSLPDLEPVQSGPFERKKLRDVIDTFMAGEDRHLMLIRQLLLIVIWHQAQFGGARHSRPSEVPAA
jgi:asparagine synthase (glutamine-hydrolysing)